MALSGSFTGTTSNQYIVPKITWSAVQSIDGNYSDITATLSYSRTNTGYTTEGTWNGTIQIGIRSYYGYDKRLIITYDSNTVAFTATHRVYHNSDGSLSVTIAATGSMSGTSLSSTTISSTVTLDSIPQLSNPTLSASSVTMGNSITITTNRRYSGFTHVLSYTFNGTSGTIASNVGDSYTWTVPLSLANAIPNATSAVGTIICETFNGSNSLGSKSVTFTATVPNSAVPVISNVSISEAVAGIAAKFGGFVQGKSQIVVGITAAGIYGSTITTYETYIESVAYYGSSITSNVIGTSGTISVITTVTDSRGRTAQVSNSVTILPYSIPQITTFSVYRCDTLGTEDTNGTRAKITVDFSISPVNNLNDKYYEVVYRIKGQTTWNILVSANIYSRNDSFVSSSLFNTDYAYELGLNLYDYFSEDHSYLDIPTAFTIIDFKASGGGIAFGKVSEKNAMEIAMDVDLTGEFLQEDRQAATLLNGWVNYGGGYETACYWKDKCGIVHISGFIKGGSTGAETVLFTLPTGYRPRSNEKVVTVSLNAFCVLDIYSSGNVVVKYGANSGWISLCNISFRAA